MPAALGKWGMKPGTCASHQEHFLGFLADHFPAVWWQNTSSLLVEIVWPGALLPAHKEELHRFLPAAFLPLVLSWRWLMVGAGRPWVSLWLIFGYRVQQQGKHHKWPQLCLQWAASWCLRHHLLELWVVLFPAKAVMVLSPVKCNFSFCLACVNEQTAQCHPRCHLNVNSLL